MIPLAPAPEAVETGVGDVLLWGVLPYVVLAVVVGGSIWRYRYDQFGWTTRSSQLYESRILRIASPLFHFGILAVLAARGCCVMLATHDLDEAERVADRAVVLHAGRVVLDDTVASICRDGQRLEDAVRTVTK